MRAIDCVGYMVNGALGGDEESVPRMVRTPWFDHDIPFDQAAELGTKKVISEHSTVGVIVLTDGSITGIERDNYREAEDKVFAEMKRTGKPFAVVLNSSAPESDTAKECALGIAEKYGVQPVILDVLNMTLNDINTLLEDVLNGFPLRTLSVRIPEWITQLGAEHPLTGSLIAKVREALPGINKMRDHRALCEALSEIEEFETPTLIKATMGDGCVLYEMKPQSSVFYDILSRECGCEIENESALMKQLKLMAKAKTEYDRIGAALEDAEEYGYGLVPPRIEEMVLDRPEIVRHGNRFGVRLKAHASGLHIIRVDVESEVNPLVGTDEQGEELAGYLMRSFETNPEDIWTTNIFGKPIYDLVRDGMTSKTNNLPPEVRLRLRDTLTRMVNDGCSGLICILL